MHADGQLAFDQFLIQHGLLEIPPPPNMFNPDGPVDG